MSLYCLFHYMHNLSYFSTFLGIFECLGKVSYVIPSLSASSIDVIQSSRKLSPHRTLSRVIAVQLASRYFASVPVKSVY